jgi:tetratricopeptide (TPR) repeat protein
MINLSVSPVNPGQDRMMIRDLLVSGVGQSVQADQVTRFQQIESRDLSIGDIPARLARYRSQAPGSVGDLVFVFAPGKTSVVIFNIVVQTARRGDLEPAAMASVRSLVDPALALTARYQPKPPTSRGWGSRTPVVPTPNPKTKPTWKPKPKPRPKLTRRYQEFEDSVSGLAFEYPQNWTRSKPTENRFKFSGKQGSSEWATTINFQILKRSVPRYASLASAKANLIRQVKRSGGKILGTKATTYGGVSAEVVHCKVQVQGAWHVFRYIYLARPGIMALVSFVAPTGIYSRLKPHVIRFERSLRTIPQDAPGSPPAHRPPPTQITRAPDHIAPPPRSPDPSEPSLSTLLNQESQAMEMVAKKVADRLGLKKLCDIRAKISYQLFKQGKVERAVDYLSNSVSFDPTHADRYEALADMLDDLPAGMSRPLAQSYYESALKLDPSRKACRIKLASLYLACGEFEDARFHYQVLTENQGKKPDASYVQDLLLSILSSGKLGEGVEFLRKTFFSGGDPALGIALGILLDANGETAAAVNQLRGIGYSGQATPAQKKYASTLVDRYSFRKGGR